jgi:hypothetical protein
VDGGVNEYLGLGELSCTIRRLAKVVIAPPTFSRAFVRHSRGESRD